MDTKHMIIAKKKKKPEISSSSSSPTGILTISQLHFDVSCFYALVIPSSSSGKPWDSSPSVKMLLSSWPSEVSCSYGSLISSAGNDRSWNLNFYKPLIWVLNVDLRSVVAFIIYALVLSLSIYVSFLLNHNIRFWGQSHCLICLYSCYRRYNKHLLEKNECICTIHWAIYLIFVYFSIHILCINTIFVNERTNEMLKVLAKRDMHELENFQHFSRALKQVIWCPDLRCAARVKRKNWQSPNFSIVFKTSSVSDSCDQILICQVKSCLLLKQKHQTLNQGKCLKNQQDHKTVPEAFSFQSMLP